MCIRDRVVSFVVMLVVTHGFMSKTEIVSQQRLEETKILSPKEILLGVLTTLFGDVVFVLILIVLTEMLVSMCCDAVVVCVLVHLAIVMIVQALILVVQELTRTILKATETFKFLPIYRHCRITPQTQIGRR